MSTSTATGTSRGSKQITRNLTLIKHVNFKLRRPVSQAPDISRSKSMAQKKTSKRLAVWKDFKLLVNKAASKIPKAPTVLSQVKRCSGESKIPTPRAAKDNQRMSMSPQMSNVFSKTKETSVKEKKTPFVTTKRKPKRHNPNDNKPPSSSRSESQDKTSDEKKSVFKAFQRKKHTASPSVSTPIATSKASPYVYDRRAFSAKTYNANNGFRDDSVQMDREACSREDCIACDPPVHRKDNEGRSESRASAKIVFSTPAKTDLIKEDDNIGATRASELYAECQRCRFACVQASKTADRLLEEIGFIQDQQHCRPRREKIPSWLRKQYQALKKRQIHQVETRSVKQLRKSIRDSPVDAVTPTGISSAPCMKPWTDVSRRSEDFEDIFNFVTARGQTPINLSGAWMHQLQDIAATNLEASLQNELRTCLARLAKLEFENRALKELVLIKCGLPKHLGIHRLSRTGSTSTLAEDPEDYCASESSFSERLSTTFHQKDMIDSANEVFIIEVLDPLYQALPSRHSYFGAEQRFYLRATTSLCVRLTSNTFIHFFKNRKKKKINFIAASAFDGYFDALRITV